MWGAVFFSFTATSISWATKLAWDSALVSCSSSSYLLRNAVKRELREVTSCVLQVCTDSGIAICGIYIEVIVLQEKEIDFLQAYRPFIMMIKVQFCESSCATHRRIALQQRHYVQCIISPAGFTHPWCAALECWKEHLCLKKVSRCTKLKVLHVEMLNLHKTLSEIANLHLVMQCQKFFKGNVILPYALCQMLEKP